MPFMNPASLQAMDLRSVWYVFLAAALFVAVVVYGLLFFAVAKWRMRRADSGALPEQFHSNPPIEIMGVVIPLLMVGGLFYITYARERFVDVLHPNPYAVVNVTAYRWSWEFAYPGHGITMDGTAHNPPVLVLPLGRMTQINLNSADVVHAFWVPAFLFKRDATPGYSMHFDITPTRTGTFAGTCAEYCGLDHALMRFSVRVVPAAVFDRWLSSGGSQTL
jgi:cytochrome c oxidase subunit II